jgi:hypothetical protein
MTTYNTGYPISNDVAVPPVMTAPQEKGGRVRIAYGYILATAAATPAAGSVINITKLPLGAKILVVLTKWQDMSSDAATITLKAGATAISAALAVATARAAYAFDYTGVNVDVTTEALRQISGTTATGTLNETAGNKFSVIIWYVLD